MMPINPVELARALLRIDTCGPEAREAPAIDLLAGLLSEAGFQVETHAFAPGRPSLLARLAAGHGRPLLFSGHLDTVPIGAASWRLSPFAAVVSDGFLHGRGSADMKGGVAALVAAAIAVAQAGTAAQPLVLALTAGEEIGCLGALHLQRLGVLPRAAGILVAEPTGNRLALGHRGALWLRADYSGRGAHGSTPHLGHNAIYDAADGVRRCRDLRFPGQDPLLGAVSLNVGTMTGGLNINSVPDHASFTIDIRSIVPGTHSALTARVADALAPEGVLRTLVDLPAVRAEQSDGFPTTIADVLRAGGLPDQPTVVPFFTDASILGEVCGAPCVILGPGESDIAHKTDERCAVAQITQAAHLYERVASRRC